MNEEATKFKPYDTFKAFIMHANDEVASLDKKKREQQEKEQIEQRARREREREEIRLNEQRRIKKEEESYRNAHPWGHGPNQHDLFSGEYYKKNKTW